VAYTGHVMLQESFVSSKTSKLSRIVHPNYNKCFFLTSRIRKRLRMKKFSDLINILYNMYSYKAKRLQIILQVLKKIGDMSPPEELLFKPRLHWLQKL
jgi:hypothetical protein